MPPRRRGNNPAKRPIESYDHRDKDRLNNPPVGLVTPETDQDAGRKTSTTTPIWTRSSSGRARRSTPPLRYPPYHSTSTSA